MNFGFISILSGTMQTIAMIMIIAGRFELFGKKLSTIVIGLSVITLLGGVLGIMKDQSKSSAKIGLGLLLLSFLAVILFAAKEFYDAFGIFRGL